MHDEIPQRWLVECLTVEEAELRNSSRIDDDRLTSHPELSRPFCGLNQQWEELKAQIKPGDELWTFASSSDSWSHLAGRAGVALLRQTRVIASLVTIMN